MVLRPRVAGTAQEVMYRGDVAVIICSSFISDITTFLAYLLSSLAVKLSPCSREGWSRAAWLDPITSVGTAQKHQVKKKCRDKNLIVRKAVGWRSLHSWYLPPRMPRIKFGLCLKPRQLAKRVTINMF